MVSEIRLLCGAALVAMLAIGGCGQPDVAIVRGTITVDGAKPESGSIAFFPVDGRSTTSGSEIVDGQYRAAVSPGEFKVEIRVPKVVGQQKLYDTPDSPMKQILAESLPAKYNDETELTLDVQPGDVVEDFQLTTE